MGDSNYNTLDETINGLYKTKENDLAYCQNRCAPGRFLSNKR